MVRADLRILVVVIWVWILAAGTPAAAQELVPRAYWPAPQGTNALVFGYQYSTGDVVTDPTLPISGVDSRINYGLVTYQRTTGLFGRTSNLQFSLPYVDGTTTGFVEGDFRRRNLSAMADAKIQLSVNLKGAPSMNPQEFQALRADPNPIVGASILIQAPTGAYEDDKAINAGTNRWAAKLGIGTIWPIRPSWLLEADLAAWFFGDNDDFLGQTRKQAPIASLSLHLIKRIRPGFWASLDANYYRGGDTTIDGVKRADLQRNSRFGGTLVIPFKKRHGIRFSYSTGVVTESGGDYDMYTLSYLFAW